MTSFYLEDELEKIGLKSFGSNVKISRNANFYNAEQITVGSDVRIDDFCIFSGKISIGNNVHIAAYSAVYGGKKGVEIGDYANLSSRISVYASCDDYSGETMTNPTIPEQFKNVHHAPVYIGRHVIIGAMSVVLPGVSIAEGSSFGAFSFINHDSEEWSINVGIPFRKIKDRSRNLLKLEEEFRKNREN